MKKMNLQFFADTEDNSNANGETTDTQANATNDETKDNANTPTLEELKSELAKQKLENAKIKKAMDKATSEAAESKKKLKSYMSDEELKAQERAEEEAKIRAELEELRKDKALSEATNSFLEVGYNKDTAEKLANAQFNGDNETYFALLKEANDSIVKAKQNEFISSRPEPAHGTDGKPEEKDAFLQGFESAI